MKINTYQKNCIYVIASNIKARVWFWSTFVKCHFLQRSSFRENLEKFHFLIFQSFDENTYISYVLYLRNLFQISRPGCGFAVHLVNGIFFFLQSSFFQKNLEKFHHLIFQSLDKIATISRICWPIKDIMSCYFQSA